MYTYIYTYIYIYIYIYIHALPPRPAAARGPGECWLGPLSPNAEKRAGGLRMLCIIIHIISI